MGMVIKIIMSRYLGSEGIGIYYLLSPTMMLLITISTLSFPVAISKLVAENRTNNKNLFFSLIPISLIISIVLIIILLLSGNFISNKLLHDSRTYYGLISIGFILPFISITSLIRGYFFGKEKMFPHVLSNFLEDVVRIIILIIGIPIFLVKGLEYAVAFLVISNIFSEVTSIIVLFIFLPKHFRLKKEDIKPQKKNIKEVLDISIPTTEARLIGSIGYFFEPIILSSILLYTGFSNNFVATEYGIISGFVLPLLLLPSFFTMAISQALIPVIARSYSRNDRKFCKYKLKQAIICSLMIGIPATIFFEINPSFLLNLIYNTNEGIMYIRILAPICLLQYIQAPLSSCLQSMGKAKIAMKGTLIGTILRISVLAIGTYLFNIWGLIIATSISVIFVTSYQLINVKKNL